jgi:hypothetical protein
MNGHILYKTNNNSLSLNDYTSIPFSKNNLIFSEELLELFEYYKKKQITINNFQKHNLNNDIRRTIIEWIYYNNIITKCDNKTFYRTVSLFDHYLSACEYKLDISTHYLTASVCFLIANKLEESTIMSLEFLKDKILDKQYTLSEIKKTEFEILKTLKFNLNIPNILSFIDLIYEILKINKFQKVIIQSVYEMSIFTSIMALQIDELISTFKLSSLVLVIYCASFRFLHDNKVITRQDYDNLLQFIESLNDDNINIINYVYILHMNIIMIKKEGKGKIFFSLFNKVMLNNI